MHEQALQNSSHTTITIIWAKTHKAIGKAGLTINKIESGHEIAKTCKIRHTQGWFIKEK